MRDDVDNTEEIRCLSLCTGYAGLELAVGRVISNVRTVAYVEIEALACANLVARMEAGLLDAAPIWTDIKTFNAEPFQDRIHIVTAGYPCQPFSLAGKREGGADTRHLWPSIRRIVKAVRPVYVLLENVPGLLSALVLDNRPDLVEYLAALSSQERTASARDRWYIGRHRERLTQRWLREEGVEAFAGVYLDLHDMGYSVETGLFTASEVGAPHRRQRLFILAYNSEFGRRTQPEIQQGQESYAELRGPMLADNQCGRAAQPQRSEREQRGRAIDSGEKVADSGEQGLQESGTSRLTKIQPATFCRWPARPGQPQYEWEEPRVVGDASGGAGGPGRTRGAGPSIDEGLRNKQQQTKSRLDRAVDGTACRVDRLRLLGNGVVPQQAERALRYLIGNLKGELKCTNENTKS